MMHPVLLEQVAAEHVKDMIASAEKTRHRQEARRARQTRRSPIRPARVPAFEPDREISVATQPNPDRSDNEQLGVQIDQLCDLVPTRHGHKPVTSG